MWSYEFGRTQTKLSSWNVVTIFGMCSIFYCQTIKNLKSVSVKSKPNNKKDIHNCKEREEKKSKKDIDVVGVLQSY